MGRTPDVLQDFVSHIPMVSRLRSRGRYVTLPFCSTPFALNETTPYITRNQSISLSVTKYKHKVPINSYNVLATKDEISDKPV